jgi:hypothetical protein
MAREGFVYKEKGNLSVNAFSGMPACDAGNGILFISLLPDI